MNAPATPLVLVSFTSPSFGDLLCAALRALDYQVRSVPGSDWLAQGPGPLDGPVVLALGAEGYPHDRLLSGLLNQRIVPALAVISGEQADWDTEILACCQEFLCWPCQRGELSIRLARGCEGAVRPQASFDESALLDQIVSLNLIGQSPAFLSALELIKALSQWEAPVLIEGETGTGKEVAARAIHYLGLRRDFPFVPVNCGALSDSLLENELFGHERGAYTDAKEAQAGLVAQAHGGTLFFDEVEALSPKAQATLLRFCQNQEFRPLGSRSLKQANVRIIAASNVDLGALVGRGDFRQDLFFRLNVMPLYLPPLRERPGDIELLAGHFLYQYSANYHQSPKAFHPATLAWMRSHRWPGNVRELENFVHRALLLSKSHLVTLPVQMLSSTGDGNGDRLELLFDHAEGFKQGRARTIAHFERQYLQWLMVECRGNVTLAAQRAGKERRALGRLIKKYQIDRAVYRT